MPSEKPFWNPYVAGIVLGLVVLLSFVITGRGIGSSGGIKRLSGAILHSVDPTFAEENKNTAPYFANPSRSSLNSWIVFLAIGVAMGGFLGVFTGKRFQFETLHGPRIDDKSRWILALFGGIISAWGAEFARGCTSGQAVTGGAQLAFGSWIFMFAVFGGAYALAYFNRKQWL
jgi:hypothetical protein